MEKLEDRTARCLQELQAKAGLKRRAPKDKYKYPGAAEDKLFEADYRHKHHIAPTCICRNCGGDMDPICDPATVSSCAELGCDDNRLVQRDRLDEKQQLGAKSDLAVQEPAIYIGAIASGDTVIKSAAHRDRIAEKHQVVAFEMEGAGIWDEVPCIVVKGVCDYAYCHKNKGWQVFASATAAAAARAIFERYTQTDGDVCRREATAVIEAGDPGKEGGPASGMSQAVFNGPIQGRNVILGSSMTGGTYTFN
jgi:hypothetical protein